MAGPARFSDHARAAVSPAVATARATERGLHGPEPAAAPVAASPCLNAGSASARANSCALVNRSAGSFSSAFRMAASTLAGTVDRLVLAATNLPAMICPRTA